MTSPPAIRSGRPHATAGPLASALIAVLATVGLGCAAAAAPVSSPPAGGLGPTSDRVLAPASVELSLRTTAKSPVPAARPLPVTRRAPDRSGPPVPVRPATAANAPAAATRDDHPVRIRIDAVDVEVRIVPTGVAEDGSMALPDTVRRAGWYRFSPTPGSRAGSTVIGAHVDTRSEGLGPFARISGADEGDRIVVTDRSGEDHRYRVETVRRISRARLPVDDLFDRDGAPRLVLITCGGAYDARYGYLDNVVVLAEPET